LVAKEVGIAWNTAQAHLWKLVSQGLGLCLCFIFALYTIYIMLSEKEIEKLWQAYQEHPSAYFAAKKCNVSRTTATKYRDLEHGDERLPGQILKGAPYPDSRSEHVPSFEWRFHILTWVI